MRLDELVAALDGITAGDYEGRAYRHVAVGYNALSGEGARRAGGRWNPPESFATLYAAADRDTAIREFRRLVARQNLTPASFLPRDLFTYDVRLQHVVDLMVEDHVSAVGLTVDELRADDARPCQAVGEAAHHAGFEAILAPSATQDGEVLAIFLDRLLPGSVIRDVESKRWEEPADIPTS